MTRIPRLLLLCLLCLLACGLVPSAPGCDQCSKVKVDFFGDLCADGEFRVTLNGVEATGNGPNCQDYTSSTEKSVELKPNEPYTLAIIGQQVQTVHVAVTIPNDSCHEVLIDGKPANAIDYTNTGCVPCTKTWTITIRSRSDIGGPGTGGDNTGGSGTEGGGVEESFSVGGLDDGSSAGVISLSSGMLQASTYTPADLRYAPPASSAIDPIWVNGVLTQVKTPEVLANVVVLGTEAYQIEFYRGGTKSGNLYIPTGAAFVTYRVEKPTGTSVPSLRVTETRGSVVQVREYAQAANSWTLSEGGLRQEINTSQPVGNPENDVAITTIVKNPTTNVVSSKRKQVRRTFPWGEETIRSIDDPDGDALTTEYVFYAKWRHRGSRFHRGALAASSGSFIPMAPGSGMTITSRARATPSAWSMRLCRARLREFIAPGKTCR